MAVSYLLQGGALRARPMEAFLGRLLDQAPVIALVGAGGKTTLMYALAERSRALGRSTLATTTTHIFRPQGPENCRDLGQCQARWRQGEYAVWGTEGPAGKLGALSPEDFSTALAAADQVLVEADGARRMACKAPAAHEPQIPAQAGLVVAVAGLTALGRSVAEGCFRPEWVCALLGCSMDHILTPAGLARLLASEAGGRKGVGGRAYWAVLNQCDGPRQMDQGLEVLKALAHQGVQGALTCFLREGEERS